MLTILVFCRGNIDASVAAKITKLTFSLIKEIIGWSAEDLYLLKRKSKFSVYKPERGKHFSLPLFHRKYICFTKPHFNYRHLRRSTDVHDVTERWLSSWSKASNLAVSTITFLSCAAERLPYRPACRPRNGRGRVSGKMSETKTPEQAQELRRQSHV